MSCFEDCIHYAGCEHRNPNLCGVAAPCSCFPAGDTDNCPCMQGRAKPNTLYIWELIYEYEAAEQHKTKTPGLR